MFNFNLKLRYVRSGNYCLELLTRADIPQVYIETEFMQAEFLSVVTQRRVKNKVTYWFNLGRLTTENLPNPSFTKEILGPEYFAILSSEDLEEIVTAEFRLYRRKGLGARLKEREPLTI